MREKLIIDHTFQYITSWRRLFGFTPAVTMSLILGISASTVYHGAWAYLLNRKLAPSYVLLQTLTFFKFPDAVVIRLESLFLVS